MFDLARKTVSHATVYGVGNILRYAASFLMLPVYTRYLEPADYGVVELLQMLVDATMILTGMRIGAAILRYYYMADAPQSRGRIVGSGIVLVLLMNGLAVGLIVLGSDLLARLVLGDPALSGLLALFSITMICGGIAEVGMTFLRAQQRPGVFVGFSMLKLVVHISLSLVFLVGMGMKVEGVVYASVLAHLTQACALLGYLAWHGAARGSVDYLRQLLGFSWPIMIAELCAFYLVFGDRLFLRLFHSLHEVGLYALAYKFGFLLVVVAWTPFMMIWGAMRFQLLERDDSTEIFRKVFALSSTMVVTCALGIALLAPDVLAVMANPEFQPAARVVPVIMLAYLFHVWTEFCDLGILARGNTLQLTYGSLTGGAVITIAYVGLIPVFGPMGAAWATVAGYATRCAWVQWQSERQLPIGLEWGRVAGIVGLAVIAFGAGQLAPEDIVLAVPFKLACVAGFIVAVVLMRLIRPDERDLVLAGLGSWVPRPRPSDA